MNIKHVAIPERPEEIDFGQAFIDKLCTPNFYHHTEEEFNNAMKEHLADEQQRTADKIVTLRGKGDNLAQHEIPLFDDRDFSE